MANKCPEAENCGYLKWRRERPDFNMAPLQNTGDCGIEIDLCQRLNPNIPIEITTYGPKTNRELVIVYQVKL